jgi:hypothetical protein
MTARAVAYYRVSSGSQALGVSLDAQRTTVRRYVEHEGMELVSEFKEAESAYRSGTPTWRRRPRLRPGATEVGAHVSRSAEVGRVSKTDIRPVRAVDHHE